VITKRWSCWLFEIDPVCSRGVPFHNAAPTEALISCGRDANTKTDSGVEAMVDRASFSTQESSDLFHVGSVAARGTEDMVGRVQSDKS